MAPVWDWAGFGGRQGCWWVMDIASGFWKAWKTWKGSGNWGWDWELGLGVSGRVRGIWVGVDRPRTELWGAWLSLEEMDLTDSSVRIDDASSTVCFISDQIIFPRAWKNIFEHDSPLQSHLLRRQTIHTHAALHPCLLLQPSCNTRSTSKDTRQVCD